MLPLRARVDLGAMAMKGYSANLTIRLFSVISGHSLEGGVLPLCREAVRVLYSHSRLGNSSLVYSETFDLFITSFTIIVFLSEV